MANTIDRVQVKGRISGDLRRRAYVVLAERELKFNGWLQRQLEMWVSDAEKERAERGTPPAEATTGHNAETP